VHDHDAVPGGQRRDRLRRDLDVPPLDFGGHRVTALQQRVAAQRDHDPHSQPPRSGDLAESPAGVRER